MGRTRIILYEIHIGVRDVMYALAGAHIISPRVCEKCVSMLTQGYVGFLTRMPFMWVFLPLFLLFQKII